MALVASLMGVGMPAEHANRLGFGSEATGLAGTGSASTDALQLTAGVNVFSTVNSGTGATLPSNAGGFVAVINGGSNALLVYPGSGMQINNATVSTGSYSVANGKTAMFVHAGGRWIATLST